MTIIILIVVFFLVLMAGSPILAALGIGALAAMALTKLGPDTFTHVVYHGLLSFTLVAIPLFLLAGEIMARGGISRRLVRFVVLLVGWLPGGLGIAVVIATMIFSGISGSVNADAAAIGAVMLPPMIASRYRPQWAAAIVAAAAGTGILIPPSITMIVLGTVANLSIKQLFLASLFPAVLIAVTKIIVIFFRAKLGIEPSQDRVAFSAKELGSAFLHALPALLGPGIIIGGILSGIFTPTEAGAVACLYAGVLASVFYREIGLKDFADIAIATLRLSGVVVTLVGVATAVSYMIAREDAGTIIAAWCNGFIGNYALWATIVMLIFWLLGALMDGIPALIILVPLFMPIAERAGMGPIHFAIFALATFGVSLVTPPIGTAAFIVASLAHINVRAMIPPMFPFLLIMFATILILAYVPWFSLYLPHVWGGYLGK